MTFLASLRQGGALARTLPRASTCAPAIRPFHSAPKPHTFFTSRAPPAAAASSSSGRIASTLAARTALAARAGARRTYMQGSNYTYHQEQTTQNAAKKLLTGAAIFGGTLVAINVVFNRETREGAMPPFERAYLNDTFLHTGLGVGIIGLTARQMVNSGFVYRIMVTNPWIVAIGGLGLSFATMIGTRSIDPSK